MAGYLGVMAQANIDEDTSGVPPESDRRTAEIHGEHIAAVTRDLVWGRQLAGQSGLAGTEIRPHGLARRASDDLTAGTVSARPIVRSRLHA